MAKIFDLSMERRKRMLSDRFEKYRTALSEKSGQPQIGPILKTVDKDFQQKDYHKVILACRTILAANQGHADLEVYFKLAFSLFSTRQYQEAQEACHAALDRFDRKGIFFNILGDSYLEGTHPTNFRQAMNFFYLAIYHARHENDHIVAAKALTSLEMIKTRMAVFQKLND